jgi:AcrR family transcriptional regulator
MNIRMFPWDENMAVPEIESITSETRVDQARGRRERRIERKRAEILAAAAHVFGEKGFSNATTRDIANQADMGESTLYNYFSSKSEILLAILEEAQGLFEANIQAARTTATRQALVEMVERGIADLTTHLIFLRTVLVEAKMDDPHLHESVKNVRLKIVLSLRDYFASQIEAGWIRSIDPLLGARFTMGLFLSIVMPSFQGMEPPPSSEQRHMLAEEMVSLLMDGLHTQDNRPV